MAKIISLSLPDNPLIIVFGFLIVSVLYTAFRLLATFFQVYKFRQRLSQSIIGKYNFLDSVMVLFENKPIAYCFGIRKPKIFITTGLIKMVNKKELELVLRHEKYHLENRDNLILLLATFIESLFPFFPILTDLIRIYKTDRELLADKAAIQDESDKYALSSVLKKLLSYQPTTVPALVPEIADLDTLETRIKSLHSPNKVNYRRLEKRNFLYSTVFVAILITLIGAPVKTVELHRNGVDAMIVCTELLPLDK